MRRRIPFPAAARGAALSLLILSAPPAAAEPAAKKLFGVKKDAAAMSPRAIGSYARGCLAGGARLPVSGPGWEAMKLQRNRNWGHPVLIGFLERFAAEATREDGWPGLLIGDLAQPRGGPMLTGHKSHQIGLDADIWYKPKPEHELTDKERADSWSIPLAQEFSKTVTDNWKPGYAKILKRAASYPETARIFVHPAVKKKLCEVAGDDREWLRKIRPWWKHNYHFHVRLKCPAGFDGCENQNPPPAGDGCGAPLDYWMKQLEKAEAWSKQKPKEPKKAKPRKELGVADLPAACRTVLDAPPPGRRTATSSPASTAASAAGEAKLPWRRDDAPAMPLPTRRPR